MAVRRSARTTKAAKPVEPELDEFDDIEEDDVEEDEVEEAPAPRKRTARKAAAPAPAARRRRPAPEPEPEEDEDEEEIEEDEPAPKKRVAAKKAAPAKRTNTKPKYNTTWLAEFVEEKTGKAYKTTNLRGLLRRLAKRGEFDRVIGEDTGAYSFTGPKDPIAALVVKAVKAGEMDADRNDKMQALRDKKAAKAKKAAPVEDVEDLEDDEELEDEDD